MLKKTNPRSVMDIVCDSDSTFVNMFMAVATSIKGREHCRPVIAVDGTFLKCKFGGTLITTCTQDANN